jgi:DNA-binding response OmpR family regulator
MSWTGTRVLMAVGHPARRRTLSAALRAEHMQVLEAAAGLEALSHLRSACVDVAVLDVGLAEINGLELVRRVRRESTVPIILFTARGDEASGIAGLEAGADDYLPSTCPSSQLVARIRAVVRRARAFRDRPSVLRGGLVELELNTRRCLRDGVEVTLTPHEFDLLAALLSYEGRIHTRSQLLALVWGDAPATARTVDGHVASLRRKLAPGIRIVTLRGVGYRLDAEESPVQPLG